MQWNARSAVSNKQSLKQFLVNEDIDIALISETWFKPNKTYSFVGYNIVRQDRYDGITGTAILIKREYQFVEIDIDQNAINSDISLCAIKLKLPNDNNLTLASLYKSPQIVTTSQDWKNCFDLFLNHASLVVISTATIFVGVLLGMTRLDSNLWERLMKAI
nr:unnamed protein product [Callosobruchus chinensis]